ncbi:modifier of mdg4-like isoform X10 [Anopheles albimanus]|uniref:modifier of mdg4-like isoform X10 n=1 Tax=Anopheles albimanus TaxID=7167 RepID=UPI001640E5FE|nr:modifier of mdg4-like isoform X10 [Anopheles albimanus]
MADDEQFSLCWNNFNSNLSAGFHDSLVQGDLVDVTLAAEGHLVKAHRLILSVCSPYFRKMFMQMPVNQHAFIFLKDVSHSVLKDLIQFMYCGEVNVKQEALPGFISTAEALQIKGLTETGDSAPPQASPAKEIPSTPAPVSISTSNTVSPRGKSQRTRAQSYKLESEESGDDKIVQIQTPASHHSVTVSQQVQQVQQLHVASGQKRVLGQRHVQPSQITKRAKISVSSTDVLDPSDNTTQIQTVQIVKQLPSQPAEPEYVDLAMESINTKAEPDYAEEPAEIETVEAETEQDQSLTENEQTVDQEQGDDGDQYVDDDAYGELSKYDESYFTEGEDGKPGASGFGESYASDGTSNEQASQGVKDEATKADYRNNQSAFELPDPVQPGVSSVSTYRLVNKVDNTDVHQILAETFSFGEETLSSNIDRRIQTPRRSKSTTINFEEITNRNPVEMRIIPTRKGGAGLEHNGHHFVFRYSRNQHKVYRCAWHNKTSCQAQVLIYDKLYYVVDDEHSHRQPSRIDVEVLGKVTLKVDQ